jgi:hypothetical protein
MEKQDVDGMEERELEQAEDHLRKAEADLEASRAAERTAELEINEALQEIEGAEHHRREIHFVVDGEAEETEKREMTPDEIIRQYGRKDPATNYLIQIEGGHEKISYRDHGSEAIKLHNGMQFQIISLEPTPVSEGPIRSGVEVFIDALKVLGYSPVTLSGEPDHVMIDYEVQSGRFVGKKVRHGFIVPSDFPVTPPSGPHVSPQIYPINTNGGHPTGAVHHTQALPFEAGAGGAWEYWSRPVPDWARSKKTVAVYMSHIWRLWASQ